MRRASWIMAGALALSLVSGFSAMAAEPNDCPNGGTVRFGVEPYDTAARLVPIYKKVGKLIGDKLGCKVEVFVATSYNAEIEAMRNGKLEIGEFGPLGYVLAHQVAKPEAVAAFGTTDGKPACGSSARSRGSSRTGTPRRAQSLAAQRLPLLRHRARHASSWRIDEPRHSCPHNLGRVAPRISGSASAARAPACPRSPAAGRQAGRATDQSAAMAADAARSETLSLLRRSP